MDNTEIELPAVMEETASFDALKDLSARLAFDLVANIEEKEDVLERYGITEAQWERLRNHPEFKAMCREAMQKWNGTQNANKRIQTKAEILVEENLPVLHQIVQDIDIAPASRIDAFRTIARMAGSEKPEDENKGSGAAGGFTINITMSDSEKVVINGTAE